MKSKQNALGDHTLMDVKIRSLRERDIDHYNGIQLARMVSWEWGVDFFAFETVVPGVSKRGARFGDGNGYLGREYGSCYIRVRVPDELAEQMFKNKTTAEAMLRGVHGMLTKNLDPESKTKAGVRLDYSTTTLFFNGEAMSERMDLSFEAMSERMDLSLDQRPPILNVSFQGVLGENAFLKSIKALEDTVAKLENWFMVEALGKEIRT